ncbi:MAG: 3-deoxy-D-manno-octulosonic acid transferase [candidate division Zixibacteria bacterium]|nr:3-deoxy-D-manno-octulosonic acid transferase [candidate division Zixibacteria bacterium]
MYLIYDLLYTIAFILLFPYLILRGLIGGHGILERLGKIPAPKDPGSHLIWFHASSVGEIKALAIILPKLSKVKPDLSFVVSVMTKTGKKQAQQSLPQADFIFYLPLDFPFLQKKIFRKLNPRLLGLVETELWPNLIRQAKIRKTKLCLINGRLSEKSFRRYLKLRSFFYLVLSCFDQFLMQSPEDAQKLWDLGGAKEKTKVVGNLKFDRTLLGINDPDKATLRKSLGLSSDDRLITAGSTHPDEEKIILSVYKRLKPEFKELVLLIAPRHLSRIGEIEELLLEQKLDFIRKSFKKKDDKPEVILLDTMGELEKLYSISEIAFVGGSLVPIGGHNILEPASYGVPTLFGPYMDNFKAAANLLLSAGGGIMVKDQEELYQKIYMLLENTNLRNQLGIKSKETLLSQTGTSDKTVQLLLDLLAQNEKK